MVIEYVSPAICLVVFSEELESNNQQTNQVNEISKQKHHKVFMVVVAQAIVNKWTVMIKHFHTATFKITMERCFAFDYLIINT